ncbi:hypothetical protein [Moraxella bovoculi]|uniref:hypothetical protein n=1 Tax=Moraxella bovoculi TaxID=386891 RepID=UPI000AB39343|nr:hypothetical protein [Moraxella bovoculi]
MNLENAKLQAEIERIEAETEKIRKETKFYPIVLLAISSGVTTIIGIISTLVSSK